MKEGEVIMVKTKIVETIEKYDKDGKLIEKITREETTEDDEMRYSPLTVPDMPQWKPGEPGVPWYTTTPWCIATTTSGDLTVNSKEEIRNV